MTSDVNWAVLGLLIERSSYGFELYCRYQRIYGAARPISGESHIYSAIDALKARGLIQTVPGVGASRQPKPTYKATRLGARSYEDWLVKHINVERNRQELWVRQLTIFAPAPKTAIRLLGRFEHECLKSAHHTGNQAAARATGSRDELINELIDKHRRIGTGAMLSWLRQAIASFEARAHDERLGM